MLIESDQDAALKAAGSFGAVGLVVSIFRGVIEMRHGSLRQWASGAAAAVLASVLVGLGLASSGIPPFLQWSLIGACAYLADDVLEGLKAVGSLVRNDPLGAPGRIIDAFRRKGGGE